MMSFLFVKVYYGPCDSFGSISVHVHKPQFLYGFRDYFQKLGFRVQLVPVEFLNYCMIELCGHEVFRCNIKNLHFNTTSDRDLVCQRAINAVLQSAKKFRRARTYLWFWSYLDHELFKREECTMCDYWAKDVELENFEDHDKCIRCCNIYGRTIPKENQKV